MKHFIDAAHNAAHSTAAFMTADLRSHAYHAKWDGNVINNMHVMYDGKSFSTQVHPDHHAGALFHEYGDETTRPTAVIRNFGNDTRQAERAMITHIARSVGGLL